MANTIQLTGGFKHVEGEATTTIAPGMLLEVDSSGRDQLAAHNTANGFAERLFAVEDALRGRTVDDGYVSGDLVSAHLVDPGSEVQAFLDAGENASIGDFLVAAGSGTLQVVGTSANEHPIAVALEALNLSGSGAVPTLMDVRVL
jgi:hypothetical protein